MKIIDTICYSKLLWLQTQVVFNKSIYKLAYSKPDYASESMAGYIETKVEIDVLDFEGIAKCYQAWVELSNDEKMDFYNIAMGYKVCTK